MLISKDYLHMLPIELTEEILYSLKSLDIIPLYHTNFFPVLKIDNFWKNKIYYDFTIFPTNPIYEHKKWKKYTSYELYTLIEYGIKYDEWLLCETEDGGYPTEFRRIGNETFMIYNLREFLFTFQTTFLPELIMRYNDKYAIDVYLSRRKTGIKLIRLAKSLKADSILDYIYDKYPQYRSSIVFFV
jgi:hypothetical protein